MAVSLLLFLLGVALPLKDIVVVGIKRFPEERIERLFQEYRGKELTEEVVESVCNNILEFYADKGFPFVRVYPLSITEVDSSFILNLRVEEGPLVVISDVRTRGLRKTKKEVILRFFEDAGRIFSLKRLKNEISELGQTRLVDVKGFRIDSVDGRYEIILELAEKATNRFDGALVYDGGNRAFSGYLNLEALNLFGTGRELRFRFERFSLGEQELRLKYKEPWLFGSDFYAQGGIFYSMRDTLYLKQTVEVILGYRKKRIDVRFGERYERNSDIATSTTEHIVSSVLGISYSSLGSDYIPPRGCRAGCEVEISNDRKRGQCSVNTRYPRKGKFSVGTWVSLMFVDRQGEELSYDLFEIGGAGSVRGYREKQFRASYAYLGGVEAVYNFRSNFAASLFLEGGILGECEKNHLLGYGISLSLPVKFGFIEISFALSDERDISNALVHLAYRVSF